MLEAMRVGSIDLGAAGDTPPVFTQAAHGDLLYVAADRGRPRSILLAARSQIETVADLKGHKMAFGRSSSAHHFTPLALEKACRMTRSCRSISVWRMQGGIRGWRQRRLEHLRAVCVVVQYAPGGAHAGYQQESWPV
jgi:ABC-type taurine transport system substrate-binding protein